MTRIDTTVYAPAGDIFAARALDGHIGKKVPMLDELGRQVGRGTVVAIEVIQDGRAAKVTIEVEGSATPDPS